MFSSAAYHGIDIENFRSYLRNDPENFRKYNIISVMPNNHKTFQYYAVQVFESYQPGPEYPIEECLPTYRDIF